MQKVITINVNLQISKSCEEIEPEMLNKYLSEGWEVEQYFSTVSDSQSTISGLITFILRKFN